MPKGKNSKPELHSVIFDFGTHRVNWIAKGEGKVGSRVFSKTYHVVISPGETTYNTSLTPNTANSIYFIKWATK